MKTVELTTQELLDIEGGCIVGAIRDYVRDNVVNPAREALGFPPID